MKISLYFRLIRADNQSMTTTIDFSAPEYHFTSGNLTIDRLSETVIRSTTPDGVADHHFESATAANAAWLSIVLY